VFRLLLKPIKFWLWLGLGVGLALLLALVLRPIDRSQVIYAALLWVQAQGTAGVIAYVLIYNLATVLFIPGAVLTLGGGALYGVVWGFVYAVFAATLGAILAFGIGRYLARGAICQQMRSHPHFQTLDAAVSQSGFKIVLLTRLSPILPFNLLNYAYGVTQVSFKDYVLGSLGLVPGTLLYVYLGALAGDIATLSSGHAYLTPQAQLIQGLLHALGLLSTAVVTLVITHRARHALQQTVPQTITSPKP
jgi:uncharacterized membrane protein YdjX (TVP38/TMEM64 family)